MMTLKHKFETAKYLTLRWMFKTQLGIVFTFYVTTLAVSCVLVAYLQETAGVNL